MLDWLLLLLGIVFLLLRVNRWGSHGRLVGLLLLLGIVLDRLRVGAVEFPLVSGLGRKLHGGRDMTMADKGEWRNGLRVQPQKRL